MPRVKNKKPATTEAQKKTEPQKQNLSVSKKFSDSVVARKTSRSTKPVKRADGLTVNVYDVKGKIAGKTTLPKELFAAKVNPMLMAQAVRVYLANQRKGTASTRTRGEIQASTRKIYRQKGTGRARHGAISAPIFVGGGVVFGPKPRDYALSLPKKMRRKALASALTSKVKEIKVIAGLEKLEPKTKVMFETLTALTINQEPRTKNKILLILPGKIENVQRAARNIEGVTIRPVNLLTTYEVLNNNVLLFMKDAITTLEEIWKQQTS